MASMPEEGKFLTLHYTLGLVLGVRAPWTLIGVFLHGCTFLFVSSCHAFR
jgi:hypothetical protein